jgi:hypothetical protein
LTASADRRRFVGTCDVCGAPLEFFLGEHDQVDIGVDADFRVYTWIRHYATAPPDADPDCARVSSRVYEEDEI